MMLHALTYWNAVSNVITLGIVIYILRRWKR